MTWLPAIEELAVSDALSDYFSTKLDEYIRDDFTVPLEQTSTVRGAHTPNILTRDDPATRVRLDEIREQLEAAAGFELEYYWVHLIAYEPGGFQRFHDHAHNEDYSFILYLDSIEGGATSFLLNPNPRMTLALEATPRKSALVLFLSQIAHEGKPVISGKRVLVGGLRIKGLRAPTPGWRLCGRRSVRDGLDGDLVLGARSGVVVRSTTSYADDGPRRTLTYANALGHTFEATEGTLAVLDVVDGRRTVADLLVELRARGRRFSSATVVELLRQLVAAEILEIRDDA